MKSSDTPEISKEWWTSEKPDEIKGSGLARSLANAESSLAKAEKKNDEGAIEACKAALKSVGLSADETIKKECDAKKHKEVIAVLKKYRSVINAEVKRLEKNAKSAQGAGGEDEAEEEDEKGILKESYLARMIKQLRSGKEVNFCFGVDKSAPEDSRLVLCNKRDPDKLKKILKGTGEFSNRLMTFGKASGDGKVLLFQLAENAKEPSQIVKMAKEFLKNNRDLKFKKIRVSLPDGKSFEESQSNERG